MEKPVNENEEQDFKARAFTCRQNSFFAWRGCKVTRVGKDKFLTQNLKGNWKETFLNILAQGN